MDIEVTKMDEFAGPCFFASGTIRGVERRRPKPTVLAFSLGNRFCTHTDRERHAPPFPSQCLTAMERTVALEVDNHAGELHTLTNVDDEKHRPVVTSKELGECRLVGKLHGVHYGYFDGKPAALILFHFMFHAETGRRIFRYTSASIKVNFSSTPSHDDLPNREPIVRTFFPANAFGKRTEATVENKWEIPMTIGTSSLFPVDVRIEPKVGEKTTFKKGERMEICGFAYGCPNPRELNLVQWDVVENKLEKDGIPREIFCGAIVLHDRDEFMADVTVKVRTGMSLGSIDPRAWAMEGRPWTKDDPIFFKRHIITEGVDTLPWLEGVDLSTLTEEQCQALAPLPKEHQVRPCSE